MEFALCAAGFALFALYDRHSVRPLAPVCGGAFAAGFICLAAATALAVWTAPAVRGAGGWALLAAALVFLALEIYTLFFALPFSDTYVQQSQGRLAYTEGVYALCRHPGVLWFAGGYLCLAGALGSGRLWGFCLLMSALDVAYVVLQDRWTFPHTFDNYPEYRTLAPFLIPNPASLRRCIQTLRKEVRRR